MTAAVELHRTNTIIYCDRWADTVAFYRDTLGMAVTHANDWFVEVHLADTAHLPLADATRATIGAGGGVGITLSWQVPDIDDARTALVERAVTVSAPAIRWNSAFIELFDPEGTRIELWSPTP